MQTLKEVIQDAEHNRVAIGHFNISDSNQLWGIFRAAQKRNVPVIIGTSEGERKFVGVKQAVALVESIRKEYDFPIFLNADHTYSVEGTKEAIDAGYDAVIIDAAEKSLEENIAVTQEVVTYARESGRDVLVEAELGYIGTSSKVLDDIPEGASVTPEMMTSVEDAKRFVEETGVDLIAPAVGNIHGMLKDASNPELDTERITDIRKTARVPLVLHGGSGITDENFKNAIAAGISVVHINTEIRIAYRDGIAQSLSDNPNEVAPYRFLNPGVDALQKVVGKRLDLFNNM